MTIQDWGGVLCDNDYWDCECETKYIHHKDRLTKCGRCGTNINDQPPSRVVEIKYYYDINNGWR